MRKRRRRRLKLGAQMVVVLVDDALYEREQLFGDSDSANNVIRLAGDVSLTQMTDTFFHEITHLLLVGGPLPGAWEEFVATAMGRGLAALFRDNPKLIESILETFREDK